MKKIVVLFVLFLSLVSCIEIWDDLTIHNDGSGTLRYKINLSSSKVKVNSILALDTIDGKKVPSIQEISSKVGDFARTLDAQTGISNVVIEENYTDFILKFSCDFTSIMALQSGLANAIEAVSKEKLGPEADEIWITWDGNKLKRSIPAFARAKMKAFKSKELELLKEGSYTTISRFDRQIDRFDNPLGTLSKNKQAVMMKSSTYSVKENQDLLENTIYLISTKN
ncbi:MAG: hypothetical protein NWR96_06490 [Crocinitomicaceae bacterium]|nr:hypothetical protein [Crocinitomicaceae bacterium]MDP4761264.1 hypothetical protein [Crocinitomicaceae bacterium]